VRLDLKLLDTRTGEVAAILTQTGGETDLVELVARTGEMLRGRLSLGALSASEKEAARASQPSGGDVARLYSEGLGHLRVAACSAARGPLEQAVATDPTYALARSALAQALNCLGHDDRALAEAKKAVELSANLPDHIRLTTEAQLFRLSKQPDKALEAYQKLFERFPDNFDYGFELANLQLGLGRENDFLQTMAALRRLPTPAGDNPRLDMLDAAFEATAGRFVDALARIQAMRARAEQLGMRLAWADAGLFEARIHLALKQPAEAVAVAEKARAVYEAANDLDGIAKTLGVEAAAHEAQGDRAGVERAEKQVQSIARDLENPRQMWSFKLMLGVRMLSQGRVDTALPALEDSREIARGVGDAVLLGNSATLIGLTQMMRGDLGAAEKALSQLTLDSLPADQQAGVLATLAMIDTARDDAGGARARLAQADKIASGNGKAQVALARAAILNEEERFDEAAEVAREVIGRSRALATAARFQLASALVGAKRYDQARKIVAEIETAQYRGEFAGELHAAVLRSRLLAADDLAQARKELADVAARAEILGARMLALHARDALARIELEHGDTQRGRTLLAAVARDAGAMGCARLARQARERLQKI
jgi:tetratricopeptide (TPR) repeat protein